MDATRNLALFPFKAESNAPSENFLDTIIDKVDSEIPMSERINLTSLKVLEKHSQLKILNDELKERKQCFRTRMELLEKRRKHIQVREGMFRDSLVKFEKFLRENDDKKLRAIRKLFNERSMQKSTQLELEALRDANGKLMKERQKLEKRVAHLIKYRRFLEELVKNSEYFQEIPDVLSRYGALTANLEDLKRTDQLNNRCYEELSAHLHRYREEKLDEKLSLTNALTALRRRLEDDQTENRNRENLWAYARDDAIQRISQFCQLKSCMINMYRIARCYEKYGEEVPSENTLGQLDAIKEFILDLSEIVDELK